MPQSNENVWTWMAGALGAVVVAVLGWVSRDRLKDLIQKMEDLRKEVSVMRDHLNVRLDALRSDLAEIRERVAVIEDRIRRSHKGEERE